MGATTSKKPKSFLWLLGLFLIVLGIFGTAYGIWICYNGVIIRSTRIDAITEILSARGMTRADGSQALIGIGSAVIILSILEAILGVAGALSSGYRVKNLKLFWFSLVLGICYLIFWGLGIYTTLPSLINTLSCLGFSLLVLQKKRKSKS